MNASATDATTKTSFSPMHSRLLSNAAPSMIDRAASSRSARVVHHDRRIARPPAITRLPDCAAAFTTAPPPVTHSSATPGWWKISSADVMLGSATVVITLATPTAFSISTLNSASARAAIRAPAGCGLNTAVLPAARMLMALLTMVGTECVAGSTMPITPHGARSITQRPDASLRASLRIASTPST